MLCLFHSNVLFPFPTQPAAYERDSRRGRKRASHWSIHHFLLSTHAQIGFWRRITSRPLSGGKLLAHRIFLIEHTMNRRYQRRFVGRDGDCDKWAAFVCLIGTERTFEKISVGFDGKFIDTWKIYLVPAEFFPNQAKPNFSQ